MKELKEASPSPDSLASGGKEGDAFGGNADHEGANHAAGTGRTIGEEASRVFTPEVKAELSGDCVIITSRDVVTGDSFGTAIPRIPASDPRYVKHVLCEGARFHVVSYIGNVGCGSRERCSEPDCIINKP